MCFEIKALKASVRAPGTQGAGCALCARYARYARCVGSGRTEDLT